MEIHARRVYFCEARYDRDRAGRASKLAQHDLLGSDGQAVSFKSPSPLAPLPPHPATVVQRRSPHPATLACERPPHPATVVQRAAPHPATLHCCQRAATTSRIVQRSTWEPNTNWYCSNCGAPTLSYAESPPYVACSTCNKKYKNQWSKAPNSSNETELAVTEALSKESKAKETDWSTLYLCFDQWLAKNPKEVFWDENGDSLFCNVGGGVKELRTAGEKTDPWKAVAIKPPKNGYFTHLGMLIATISHAKGDNLFIGVAANAYLVWDSGTPLSRWQWQNSKIADASRNVCHTEQLCLCALHTYLLTLTDVASISLAWWTQKDLCDWCQFAEGTFVMYWFKTKGAKIGKSSYNSF